ncbi:hypothetical protein RhiLY_01639 [Ceratobasidium sp. AG-Ba]|nr:hypothetical protein RhiLY_01639 [Ceratobasidium sp. AG-Ba]
MATSSLHPSPSNPFRDPNRTPGVTPQSTGSSLNPFLAPSERISPQATGVSQYFTPQHTGVEPVSAHPTGGLYTQPTGDSYSHSPNGPPPRTPGAQPMRTFSSSWSDGALTPQATGSGALNSQNTGVSSAADQFSALSISSPQETHAPPSGPPPGHGSTSPNPTASQPEPSTSSAPQSIFAPPPGPPPPPKPSPQPQNYAPPAGPPPGRPTSAPSEPRPPSPTPTIVTEPPPPYTPAADVRHGEVPLETGPRRAYAPEWHPDGRTWRNEAALSPDPGRAETQWDSLEPRWTRQGNQPGPRTSSTRPSAGGGSWSAYPGQDSGRSSGSVVRPPPRHPSQSDSGPTLGRSSTTASRPTPGPPTVSPTPGRALLNRGRVLAYPARYECDRCHLTGYVAYDPSNPCSQCWNMFAQPYEGVLEFAPWDQPESVTSDDQNLQRPLPASRPQPRPQPSTFSSRPTSHPSSQSPYGPGPRGGLPPSNWSSSSLRPSATISYSRRPPPGSLVVRPGDPRIGGRVCWKCSGDGWQYKTMGLETKTCSACNGLGRLF